MPVAASWAAIGQFDAASSYTGNGTDVVLLQAGVGGGTYIDAPTTARALGVPYRFDGDGDVPVEAIVRAGLTLEPGVTIEFAAGEEMVVMGDGYLVGVGTAAAPVTLRGSVDAPGHWTGLWINNTDARNRLQHAVVANGGSEANYQNDVPANISLGTAGTGARLTLADVLIRDSGAWGIARANATPSIDLAATGVTFQNTPSGAIYVP